MNMHHQGHGQKQEILASFQNQHDLSTAIIERVALANISKPVGLSVSVSLLAKWANLLFWAPHRLGT